MKIGWQRKLILVSGFNIDDKESSSADSVDISDHVQMVVHAIYAKGL